uniref:Uncharacterized protein n=1 Tax=Setaria viridis TaxID=4556 RepID=A0A4U6UX99_SETVI|nr:hypothetical protein SEVIR_4G068200v2 [Setaria viridis]
MTTCAVEYVQRRLIIPLATWPSARFVYEDNKGAASPFSSMSSCLFMRFLAFLLLKRSFFIRLFC